MSSYFEKINYHILNNNRQYQSSCYVLYIGIFSIVFERFRKLFFYIYFTEKIQFRKSLSTQLLVLSDRRINTFSDCKKQKRDVWNFVLNQLIGV
jgi:hypothetical protein